jgi:hypothetical protein
MAPVPEVVMIEDTLQYIGAFVSLSVATVAFKGFKQTGSSSLLRLATAFSFLGLGFLVEGVAGAGATESLLTTALFAGLLLETTGYFFLAFSHAIDVAISKRLGVALLVFPVISLTGAQLSATLGILSFYFVMYGFVETMYAYSKNRRPDTLLIAGGLALIGAGTFVAWLSLLYTPVQLVSQVLLLTQITLKEVGLLILFVPVLRFALGWRRLDGAL